MERKRTGTAEGIPRIRVSRVDEIAAAVDNLGIGRGRPVLVLVGGAGGMDQKHHEVLGSLLVDRVLPLVGRDDGAVVDGGTDSGVMRVVGQARASADGGFPLVGVAAEGTVNVPGGGPALPDAADLEPNHTHFVLVPGSEWGDESPWLIDVADVLADGFPSVTVVVNGGEITLDDVARSLERGRPVVVLAGTGRTADAIAVARSGRGSDPRAVRIAGSTLMRVVDVGDADAIAAAIDAALRRPVG